MTAPAALTGRGVRIQFVVTVAEVTPASSVPDAGLSRSCHAGDLAVTRLVARVRDAPATPEQRIALDRLLEVPPGGRVSELERWRTGPAKASGPGMVKALDLASEVGGAGFGAVKLDQVPQRRLAELARYGCRPPRSS